MRPGCCPWPPARRRWPCCQWPSRTGDHERRRASQPPESDGGAVRSSGMLTARRIRRRTPSMKLAALRPHSRAHGAPRACATPRLRSASVACSALGRLALASFGSALVLAGCGPDPVAPPKADAAIGVDGLPTSSDIASSRPSGLAISAVTPGRGAIGGGDQTDVQGAGFAKDAKVFFGDREAEVLWRSGTTHLHVVAPPAAVPGIVDVRVQNSQVAKVQLARAWTYLADVQVDSFAPAAGPWYGGTPITVRGSGFTSGDRVLVGYAEALQSRVLDSTTLVAITPPFAAMGSADLAKTTVSVRHASGLVHAAGTFTYGRPPRIDKVVPPLVGLGGGAVTLHGGALGNATTLHAKGIPALLAPGSAGAARGATLPPAGALDPDAKAGAAELVATSPFGATKLFPAFAYDDGSAKVPQLLAVLPSSGPTAGGTDVVLVALLPGGASVIGVQFDGKPAEFVQTGAVVSAIAPPHVAGAVEVVLATDAGSAVKPAAFTYFAPLELTKLTPDSGPTTGGSTADLKGKGLSKACQVRVGIWPATITAAAADGRNLSLVVPPGPAGSVDVVVTCGPHEATLPAGFTYSDGTLHVNAVLPPAGATSGQTQVKVHGSGFKKGMQVYFGGKPASTVVVQSGSIIECRTPPGLPGPVALDVVFGEAVDTLVDGFTYYSPTNPHGGTWGEPVLGTLNVTVLNIYTLQPIEQAFVQVGQPGEATFPKYSSSTDAKGQVVFSGPDLQPPATVSATKPSFSASSIVTFDARNATLLLFPHVPPSQGQGQGQPPPALPLAELRGRVLDMDKYLMMPPTNCLKSDSLADLTCSDCKVDADCPAQGTKTFHCIDNGAAGKRCLSTCKSNGECGATFACFAEPTLPGTGICKPSLGIRKVLCATTVRDIEAQNPPPSAKPLKGPFALPWETAAVDEATGDYVLSSRLDELAVVCIGGYVSNTTKKFVPTAMGVRRHVFPVPGKTLAGLDLKLDIALRRTLAVRLDHPQKTFGGGAAGIVGGTLRLNSWIDLGADGLVRLTELVSPGVGTGSGVSDDVDLAYQPVALPKELSETTNVYLARAEFGEAGKPPLTATLHDDIVAPGDANLRVRDPDGTTIDAAVGLDTDLAGVVASAALAAGPTGKPVAAKVLLAARNGRVYIGAPEHPSLVWVPPVVDPFAVPTLVTAAGGNADDATLVGEAGLVRRVVDGAVSDEVGPLAVMLRGVCHGPLGRVAVGDGGGLMVDRGAGWQKLAGAGSANLRAVACSGTGAVAVGDEGTAITLDLTTPTASVQSSKVGVGALHAVAFDGGGSVWAGGDGSLATGPVLAVRKPGGVWASAWPAGTLSAGWPGVRAIVTLAAGTVLVADREGGIRRVGPDGSADESPERRDLRPRAGTAMDDGRVVWVGQPGLWLGPFLTIPTIVAPGPKAVDAPIHVQWAAAPGPAPSCTRVHLDGSGFPFWWLYVGPETTSLVLPDFASLKGIQVFPPNMPLDYRIRVDRVYTPGLSINGFSTYDLEFDAHRSWSVNVAPFTPK
ncbi:MAG: hypothetical protein EXR79_12335 [Myxococcales bacterium]|nr:hypothetical protein [Myxococcales bacterium]